MLVSRKMSHKNLLTINGILKLEKFVMSVFYLGKSRKVTKIICTHYGGESFFNVLLHVIRTSILSATFIKMLYATNMMAY